MNKVKKDIIENQTEIKEENKIEMSDIVGDMSGDNIINNSSRDNFTFKDFINSKIFYVLISFIVGAIVMFVLLKNFDNNKSSSISSVNKNNIFTTTLEETSDFKKGINEVYEATVYIEVTGEVSSIFGKSETESSGSGFVYKTDSKYGYILTNYHVIEDAKEIEITFINDNEVEASLVGSDAYYDVAVLKVPKEHVVKVATIAESSSVELGDTVFTVGAPLGEEYMGTITRGIISGLNRMIDISISSGSYMMEVLQTDAPINSGNSGGPICNISGHVIGITSSKLAGTGVEGMGFAIPADSVMSIIDSLESGEEIIRPYLGVQLADISTIEALKRYYNIDIDTSLKYGAVLSYVEDKKPAAKANLKVGDIIIEMDNEKVDDVSHFRYMLYKHKVGDKIEVKYYRNNKEYTTTIELTEAIEN